MEKVRKPNNSEYYTPSSETFRIYHIFSITCVVLDGEMLVAVFVPWWCYERFVLGCCTSGLLMCGYML
jgi:hypothetical protein